MPDIDEILRRGEAARNLLSNSTLNEAFETVLTRLSRQWLGTKREANVDVQEREELHARANAITELRGELNGMWNDAIAEQDKITRAEKRQGVKNG